MTKPATSQEIAAALTRLRASAAQTREALRDLIHLGITSDLSVVYGDLSKADGLLNKLMTIDHRAVAVERKPIKRKPKAVAK